MIAGVIAYAFVKYYSFCGYIIYPYAQMLVRPYEGPFQKNMVYSLIITTYHLFLDTHPI